MILYAFLTSPEAIPTLNSGSRIIEFWYEYGRKAVACTEIWRKVSLATLMHMPTPTSKRSNIFVVDIELAFLMGKVLSLRPSLRGGKGILYFFTYDQ